MYFSWRWGAQTLLMSSVSSFPGLHSDVQKSTARDQLLERRVVAVSAYLASDRGDMTCFEKSVSIAQHQLTECQSALLIVERECSDYRHGLGGEEQQHSGLEALIRFLRSRSIDNRSSVDLVQAFHRRRDMEHDLDAYLRAISDELHDPKVSSRSATSNIV